MGALDVLRDQVRWLTFDCYGTLVDWDRGIRAALAVVTGRDVAAGSGLVDAYVRHEARMEAGRYDSYKNVQAAALGALAAERGFWLQDANADILSRTIGDWPPFGDTVDALKRLRSRYRLGVLSNVDRDLFAATQARLGVAFDLCVTAEDVRSYKPAPAHFERMLEQVGGDRRTVLHVAQSLFHDGVPAGTLGLRFVWINRYGDRNDDGVVMSAQYPDLASLAEAMGV